MFILSYKLDLTNFLLCLNKSISNLPENYLSASMPMGMAWVKLKKSKTTKKFAVWFQSIQCLEICLMQAFRRITHLSSDRSA